jgi:2',3'-cyclic-nucleotide 2'-phosphodiesterase (5'-nucleotidase family)
VNRELGYNSTNRSSDAIAKLVVKLYYEAGVAKWGDQYDIVLAGGSINVRSPYNIPRGNVTYSQLQTILPFDNKLMLCSIKGKDLIEKFLNNNDYVKYSKITASQVDPNKTYYIIADTWTSSYDWANCTEITAYDNETYARDLLAKYIEQGGWE